MGDTSVDQWDDSLAGSMVRDRDSRLVPHGFVNPNLTDEIIVFINCGGYAPELLDNRLNLASDMCFDGGDAMGTYKPIVEAGDYPFIYKTARIGNFCYRLNKLVPGEYFIDLHFAEITVTDGPKEQRLFDVYVQDEKVLSGFDIFLLVGANRPLLLVGVSVLVKDDGLITVRFQGTNGRPLVCGLCLTKPHRVSGMITSSQDEKTVYELKDMIAYAVSKREEADMRSTSDCRRILASIKLLSLSTEAIQASDAITKLQPLLSSHNFMIRKETKALIDHLRAILHEDISIPPSTSCETKNLFEMLRKLCGKRFSRDISSCEWIRISLIVRNLLRISEFADSDLSIGSTMGLTLKFLCEEGVKEVRGSAQFLSEKVSSDRERKIIRDCVEQVKTYCKCLKKGIFVYFITKKGLRDSLRLLHSLPHNRVRDELVSTRSLNDLKLLSETADREIKQMAQQLLDEM